MTLPTTLDPALSINEIVHRFPAVLGPLGAYGIDTCCRGDESLANAAASIGIEPRKFAAAIMSVAASGAPLAEPEESACGCGCGHSRIRS